MVINGNTDIDDLVIYPDGMIEMNAYAGHRQWFLVRRYWHID